MRFFRGKKKTIHYKQLHNTTNLNLLLQLYSVIHVKGSTEKLL